MKNRVASILVITIVIFIISCGKHDNRSSIQSAIDTTPPNISLKGIPTLSELDKLATHTGSSNTTVNGSDAISYSKGAVITAPEIDLTLAKDEKFAYAVYKFGPYSQNNYPTEGVMDYRYSIFWMGYADFKYGSWRWKEIQGWGAIDFSDIDNSVSPAGYSYIIFVTTSWLTIQTITLNSSADTPELWQSHYFHQIDTGKKYTVTYSDVRSVDNKPTFAFIYDDVDQVTFEGTYYASYARSRVEKPTCKEDWINIHIEPIEVPIFLDYQVIDNKPALCYLKEKMIMVPELYYTYATNSIPRDTDWIITRAFDGPGKLQDYSFTKIHEKPVVFLSLSGDGNRLEFMSTDTTTPKSEADWQHHKITDLSMKTFTISYINQGAFVYNDAIYLFVSYFDYEFKQAYLAYIKSLTPNPTKAEDWSSFVKIEKFSQYSAFWYPQIINNKLVLVYNDVDNSKKQYDLKFAIAKTDDPIKAEDWNIMSLDNEGGAQCRLLMLNDKPVIGYFNYWFDKGIYILESKKEIPESTSDWTKKLVLAYDKELPNTEIGFFVINNQLGFVRNPGIFYRRWVGSTATAPTSNLTSPFTLIPDQQQQPQFEFNYIQ